MKVNKRNFGTYYLIKPLLFQNYSLHPDAPNGGSISNTIEIHFIILDTL